MADFSIAFARSARKELEKLPTSTARRIIDAHRGIVDQPAANSLG
jgi:mRNA-degrading endonuclease RelE of RelBE toxin-antitoxin system